MNLTNWKGHHHHYSWVWISCLLLFCLGHVELVFFALLTILILVQTHVYPCYELFYDLGQQQQAMLFVSVVVLYNNMACVALAVVWIIIFGLGIFFLLWIFYLIDWKGRAYYQWVWIICLWLFCLNGLLNGCYWHN